MNKVLLLIDCQYGFIEGGNLAVEGSQEKMNKLTNYIIENGGSYDKIFLTADWHPTTHCSFKENGGIWPSHCVQFTHDAAIYQPIIDALNTIKADYTVLTKGVDEDHEEYSVFKNQKSSAKLTKICDVIGVDEIDFCGIAFDYCVKDSAIGARKAFPNVAINVIEEFCPSIGDLKETISILENNNINVI